MPKQWITIRSEMDAILEHAEVGVLATTGPDGAPYAVPLNFVYLDGCIYFHCALKGRKLANLAADHRACFTAWELERFVPGRNAGDCSVRYQSVVCHGPARIIPDGEHKLAVLTELSAKHMAQRPDPPTPEYAAKCALVEIRVAEITGKRNVAPPPAG